MKTKFATDAEASARCAQIRRIIASLNTEMPAGYERRRTRWNLLKKKIQINHGMNVFGYTKQEWDADPENNDTPFEPMTLSTKPKGN